MSKDINHNPCSLAGVFYCRKLFIYIYSKGKDNCLNLASIVEGYTIQSMYVRISPHITPNPQPRQRGYTIHQSGIRRAKLCAVGMPTHVHIVLRTKE